ncbi:uncharacterized protein LOC130647473 [Hydractinia symbiolongicarpus]|uniref:uncharacterized protein LOC130647473 n=1 Tax=Hydractinia symbiolongicarpus TaxID=13093 RepID=UPI00254EC229|nr:uncharacterized protein LOC130647473 [Hydractinia symbiolongicarpus]
MLYMFSYIFILLVDVCVGNIYFPELYEDALYKPKNLGPNPMSYQTVSRSNTTIVEWALINDLIIAEAKFSEDNGVANCTLARINFTVPNAEVCKTVQNIILIQDYTYLVSLQCKIKNRAVLVKLSKSCLTDFTTSRDWEIVYTAFDNKRELQIHLIGNKTTSVLVWLKKSQFYSIINIKDWPDSKIQLESNLVIGELQSELKVTDVAGAYDTLYVFSDSCLYSCPLTACRDLLVVADSCVLTPNNETVSGLMKTVEDGERIIILDKFITLSAESHSFRSFFSIYCAGRLTHHMYKCGGFVIQDIVMTFNMVTRSLTEHFPCSTSLEGSLIACLILGEPRIFDVSDRKSAYPISAFTVSAWRLGVAINRFGFASADIFFFEIVPSLTADPRGFIFNVRAELQPALIASRLLYPSLATSITPAESFLLVNHQTRDIWLFSHGGRLFFRDGSKENALSIDFEYAESYSFFIADTFSSAGINHNFEHPFAFFSPDGGTFAYLSYYRSPYGAFSASAITVTNATVADLRSVVSISDKVFIIQAGINPKNDHLLVVQELSNDYLTVQIFKIADMSVMSYNMSGIVAQAEVKGSWSWDDFDATESTRIWVIYFSSDENFMLASHNNTDVSTNILEYKIMNDYALKFQRKGTVPNCLAVNNYNDYLRTQLVILCAETLLSNVINQTYHVTFISAINLKPICSQSIDHKFGSLLSKYDDLFVTNIPILDFNEIAQRLVISFEKTVLMYATDTCPFRLLYRFDHTDLIAGIGMIHTGQDHKPFGITFVTYLQKVDLIGDCINGYGVDTVLPRNYFCSRCTPGHVGLGCRTCPAGFYCSDYSQLQPSGACPEGFYCIDGTSTSNPMADVLDKTATPPHLCPAGAYCPAGTAQGFANDESANAPQSCLSGYYCPMGSVKPTQEKCPENSTSRVGGKVLDDCYCKENFYGSPQQRCMPCLRNSVCHGGSLNKTNSPLFVPQGYWPDTPNNFRVLLKCYTTMSRFTPCKGAVCRLKCENRTNADDEISCKSICSDPCEEGHAERLCSACKNGYYRKSPFHCAPCSMGLRQTICVVAALLTSLCILSVYFIRKHMANKQTNNDTLISDQQLLEVLITVLLVLLGISSTASVLFMVFIVVIVYMQQLRSPAYATLTFIFYIQTLQALLQGNFMWPNFMRYLLQFLEIMYAPVPGLACLPNIYTGENLGWEGAFILIFTLPIILGFIVGFYMFITGTVQKRPVWKRAFLSYCLFMSVLQFPLSNMSLGTLSCKQDVISLRWYMTSQPWKECQIDSVIQISGILGSVFYFIGIPFTLHYWYFKKVFPDDINDEIGDMFIPGGVKGHDFFVIFLTLRWMLMSVILSFIPFTWGLQRPLILALLSSNIIFVMHTDPYVEYRPREPVELDKTERKWFDRLCMTMSGNFLDVTTLVTTIISYTALDHRDNWTFLQIKSFVIGVVNLFICLYLIIFILLEDRLTLFPKLSKILAKIDKTFFCCHTPVNEREEEELLSMEEKLRTKAVTLTSDAE